jgi:hypothetical protein
MKKKKKKKRGERKKVVGTLAGQAGCCCIPDSLSLYPYNASFLDTTKEEEKRTVWPGPGWPFFSLLALQLALCV